MTPVERDDFAHGLGETLKFYGKPLEKRQFAIWLVALGGKSWSDIRAALLEHTKMGKYAPKPRDILDIISANRAAKEARQPRVEQIYNPCPQAIADAWVWFIRATSNINFSAEKNKIEVTEAQQEEYLLTVNREAHRLNHPDSIPDEYKLPGIWQTAW